MAQRRHQDFNDDELFASWVTWIERVKVEFTTLGWNRARYRELHEVFAGNARLREIGGFVFTWCRSNYVVSAAMAFRRIVDRQVGGAFRHLLHEMATRPTVLNRARYYALWRSDGSDFDDVARRESFERLRFISPGTDSALDHFDPTVILADIETLERKTKFVQDYVEQTFAHASHDRPADIMFDDFDFAVDALWPVFQRYYARLTLVDLVVFEPIPQYDTREVYTFPWDATAHARRRQLTAPPLDDKE